jgi:hypothetical protein
LGNFVRSDLVTSFSPGVIHWPVLLDKPNSDSPGIPWLFEGPQQNIRMAAQARFKNPERLAVGRGRVSVNTSKSHAGASFILIPQWAFLRRAVERSNRKRLAKTNLLPDILAVIWGRFLRFGPSFSSAFRSFPVLGGRPILEEPPSR